MCKLGLTLNEEYLIDQYDDRGEEWIDRVIFHQSLSIFIVSVLLLMNNQDETQQNVSQINECCEIYSKMRMTHRSTDSKCDLAMNVYFAMLKKQIFLIIRQF